MFSISSPIEIIMPKASPVGAHDHLTNSGRVAIYRIEIAGENAVIIYVSDKISPEISAQVQALKASVEANLSNVLIDLVPSYASLLVIYDVFKIDFLSIKSKLKQIVSDLISSDLEIGSLITLPVYYDTESGPDLERLANSAELSIEQFIDCHQQREYRVYAIGFAPGFAYLGEVDKRIAAPRLSTPRPRVPRGAVGIADQQTAVYPASSPGGWNLIGLCPVQMFNPDSTPSMPVAVGDRVQFEAISRDRYLAMGGEL